MLLHAKRNATCSRLSIVRFDTGPKRSMGHLSGGEKNNFFIRGAEVISRAGGMRSIRGPEVSLRSLRVSNRRVQSPASHTRELPASHTYHSVLGQPSGSSPNPSSYGSTALWRAPSACANGVGVHPPLDLPHRTSESRSAPPKSVLFGLGSARETSNTLITRGPPGLAIAVSLGPILSHL